MDMAHHVFISYAHIDNEPLIKGEDGWIDDLHTGLEKKLAMLLGEKPSIWRDRRLQGNDVFDETIVRELTDAALLVSVLSPRYVRSKWCLKELEAFIDAARKSLGVQIADKSRVFKVLKTPIPREDHPAEVKGQLGYEFYRIDPETDRPVEFDKTFGKETHIQFWAKLNDLALDISRSLEMLVDGQADAARTPARDGATIFLAETSLDLAPEREQIRRDLEIRGYKILPDRPLPLNGPELESHVREDIQRCVLSIHLVGEHYGVVPEAAQRSKVELQNALAAEKSKNNGLSRLIWMPPDIAVKDERQRSFVAAIQDDPGAQLGADVLKTSIEDLKTIINEKLAEPDSEPGTKEDTEPDHPTRIYLIFDERDTAAIEPFEDQLRERFEIITPRFSGEEKDVRQYHRDSLTLCDAVLIYYGRASEDWLKAQLNEYRKIVSPLTTKKLATSIYVAGPESPQKHRFDTKEVDSVIRSVNGFAPDALSTFLDTIKSRIGGPGR